MTLLARAIGAREALEVGTFTGYSAICIARGLEPGGACSRCDLSEEYAAIAAAQLRGRPASRTGSSSASARRSRRSGRCPRASSSTSPSSTPTSTSYPDYYEEALARTRPGGLVMHRQRPAQRHRPGPGPGRRRRGRAAPRHAEGQRARARDERVDVAMVGIADGLTLARKALMDRDSGGSSSSGRRWPARLRRSLAGTARRARLLERDGVTAAIVPGAPERSIVNSLTYRDAAALAGALDGPGRAYDGGRDRGLDRLGAGGARPRRAGRPGGRRATGSTRARRR